ncbi:MBL fold metallo-hydrolase [bacterium]|nr:MBL fold metallo-hydrolase [bacterium]
MIITYYGLEFFKVQLGDLVIGINPHGKTKFGADVALVSLPHEDFSLVENLEHGTKKPFVINGPGEYEVNGVTVRGFGVKTRYDGEETWNTIYMLSLEDMKLCFLGALGTKELPHEAKEHIEDIHIVFTPIGGQEEGKEKDGGVLGPEESYKLAIELGAKIIIPMHHDGASGEKNLKTFLKEGGMEKSGEPMDKLVIKKKDAEGKEGEIMVLSVQ